MTNYLLTYSKSDYQKRGSDCDDAQSGMCFCCSTKLCLLTTDLLFCQPRVEVTSCFVYKVLGLTFHDRINTQLIYKIEIAQVVARRITKPQRTFSKFESHWLLIFIHFFGGGEGGGLIILFYSCFIFVIFI